MSEHLDKKQQQKQERDHQLNRILASKARKKVIVAGAGTGKTFTFSKLLAQQGAGQHLAMTFIRKLIDDMTAALAGHAEVKTFHGYCKKVLHQQNGKVDIAPFLTGVIEVDADLLGQNLSGFDAKFQTLQENSPEVQFHVRRGDYYEAVGFDDAVYRLYKQIRNDPNILPDFDQIVIDEFQDFHPLEVAFIEELSKKGEILIVGDDDQAVYDNRNSSPDHLREIYNSADFEKFELPFCSRCPHVIVEATNQIIDRAKTLEHFQGRIAKRYECYLEAKEADSARYPQILLADCTTAPVIAKYVHSEILKIDKVDIAESHAEGGAYPTVLIVGEKQYLQLIAKHLKAEDMPYKYTVSEEADLVVEAYKWLLRNPRSNLAWRILAEEFLSWAALRKAVQESEKNGAEMISLLPEDFVKRHSAALELLRAFINEELSLPEIESTLKEAVGSHFERVISFFSKKEDEETAAIDNTQPTILLTSFMGCKGLSAGHVFIVGANNGSIPKNQNTIRNVEIAQFIVALTRTRKQCHIVTNQWLVSPMGKGGKWNPKFSPSEFIKWIPDELLNNQGTFKAGSFPAKKANAARTKSDQKAEE